MTDTVKPGAPHVAFNKDSMLAKAQRYVEEMGAVDSNDWRHALWSSLALELLARAALANISPVLLADEKNWNHLLAALGFSPKEAKYAPRSIATNEVLKRLGDLIDEFKEVASFCVVHTGQRNAELHSGEVPFDGVEGANWHPQFYRSCQILLASMGLALEEFFSLEEAKTAVVLMDAAADDAAKAVLGDIAAHLKVWSNLKDKERSEAEKIAKVWATRLEGHRVKCPACKSRALVFGEPCAPAKTKLEEDQIVETQEHLPTKFECVACKLKIGGLSRLIVAKLGDRYVKTTTYDAAAFYAPEDEYPEYEEDNNERY